MLFASNIVPGDKTAFAQIFELSQTSEPNFWTQVFLISQSIFTKISLSSRSL